MALTFILRIAIRVVYPRYTDSDTYFHLFFISYIRKHRGIKFHEQQKFIKPGNFYYPWLTHQLLSKLPAKYDKVIEKYLNPLLDAIYTSILFIVTYLITNNNNMALELSLLYIFTPLTFTVQTIGPRIHSFTPRLFGEVIGSMVFIFEYFYFESANTIYLLLASLCVFLVILSSRFSLQAILLISFVAFFFNFDIELLVPLFAGFTLFLLLYGQDGIALLKNHFYHIKIFFKNHYEKKSFISANNSFESFKKSLQSGSIIQFYTYLLYQNTFTSLLIKAPIIILFLYSIHKSDFGNYTYIFALSGIIAFAIVSIKPLLFLGDAERYINHVLFFLLLGSIESIYIHHWLFLLFILYGILFFIVDFFYLSKLFTIQYTDIIIPRLKQFDRPYNVFSIPLNIGGSWQIIYETKHNLLHPVQWHHMEDREKFRNYLLEYETIDLTKIEELVKEYNLDIVIIYKKLLQRRFENKLIIPKGYKVEELDDDIYLLIKEEIG